VIKMVANIPVWASQNSRQFLAEIWQPMNRDSSRPPNSDLFQGSLSQRRSEFRLAQLSQKAPVNSQSCPAATDIVRGAAPPSPITRAAPSLSLSPSTK
jgi:hypothetical protein